MGGGATTLSSAPWKTKNKKKKKRKEEKQAKVRIKSNPWDPHDGRREQIHPSCPLASKGAEAHAGPQTYMRSHTANKYKKKIHFSYSEFLCITMNLWKI